LELNKKNSYQAYTLLELLVVMGIIVILASLSFASFGGLQNTIKMNEYSLTLEQDIRSVQRAAMLLERDPDERWLYGLGIDFSSMNVDNKYKVFKWCSTFDTYGDVKTTSLFPNYDPSGSLKIGDTVDGEKNAYIPIPTDSSYFASYCDSSATLSHLRSVPGYDSSATPPKSAITISSIDGLTPAYILFEAVSGKTFFYGANGQLLNYQADGELSVSPKAFEITITPESTTSKIHKLVISNLSGKISTSIVE